MQPNFETMTIVELKKYALAHRSEVEPLRELYRRRTPDEEAVRFKCQKIWKKSRNSSSFLNR